MQKQVICFGDSNTWGYDPRSFLGERYEAPWPELLARKTGWNVVNEGENGRRIPGHPVPFSEDTDLLIIMLGTNDLLVEVTPEAAAARMEAFLTELSLPRERVVLIGPPTMKPGAWVPSQKLAEASITLNRKYKAMCERLGICFADAEEWKVPLTFDGVHFTEEGHGMFAEKLSATLKEISFISCGKIKKQPIVDTIDVVSVENMRLSDADTIARLVSGTRLMHRAAMGIFQAVSWNGTIGILCGSGNNGGDGFALACILKAQGIPCSIFTLSDNLSADSAYYAQTAHSAGVTILPYVPGCLAYFDILVDCLLGTGFQGTVRGKYRDAIEEINHSGAFVVSADINSGMNGDTGESELAVFSDVTVTIGYVKAGLITERAGKYIRRLVCADIGIVLLKEEGKLGRESAPDWLDWNTIRVLE